MQRDMLRHTTTNWPIMCVLFILNWSGRTGGEVALQLRVRPQEEEPKKKRELKKKNAAFSGDFPILEYTVDPRGCGGQRQSSSGGFKGKKSKSLMLCRASVLVREQMAPGINIWFASALC